MGATNCCNSERSSLPEDHKQKQNTEDLISGKESNPIPAPRLPLDELEFKQTTRGTLGSDYVATHAQTKSKYMLKKIKLKVIKDLGLELIKQIDFEMQSRFIVKVISAYQENEHFYIFTEYVEGSNLFRKLFINNKFTQQLARFYLAQVIIALQCFHRNHTVYRNLSPERVLIDKEGHVKLCNFGVSQIFRWPKHFKMGTMSEAVDYKSPEQAKGEDLTLYSDLWQLGTLLWHMLTGRSPFRTKDRETMLENIKEAPIFIDKQAMSVEARDLILKLLNRNPEHRLGAIEDGFLEIKQHKFFESVNWLKIESRALKPPTK